MNEICLKLTVKITERSQRRCSAVFIANFEQISQNAVLLSLLLTLNRFHALF